jgi:hypothetical protein
VKRNIDLLPSPCDVLLIYTASASELFSSSSSSSSSSSCIETSQLAAVDSSIMSATQSRL